MIYSRIKFNYSQQDPDVTDTYYLMGQGGVRLCEIPKTSVLPSTDKAQFNTLHTGDGERTHGNTE